LTRNSIISALLIVSLTMSASACVKGAESSFNGCVRSARQSCERLHATNARRCSPRLKAVPARCDIRGLVQFHVVAFTKFEVPSPMRLMTAQVPVPSGPALRLSSIGSPESDRGPPRS